MTKKDYKKELEIMRRLLTLATNQRDSLAEELGRKPSYNSESIVKKLDEQVFKLNQKLSEEYYGI